MYVFVERSPHSTMLVEMTPRQLDKAVAAAPKGGFPHYRPVSAQVAHDYVRNGGVHETPLWVDRGRIRRAG